MRMTTTMMKVCRRTARNDDTMRCILHGLSFLIVAGNFLRHTIPTSGMASFCEYQDCTLNGVIVAQ